MNQYYYILDKGDGIYFICVCSIGGLALNNYVANESFMIQNIISKDKSLSVALSRLAYYNSYITYTKIFDDIILDMKVMSFEIKFH